MKNSNEFLLFLNLTIMTNCHCVVNFFGHARTFIKRQSNIVFKPDNIKSSTGADRLYLTKSLEGIQTVIVDIRSTRFIKENI